jgi:WD40 repeat protein
MAPLKHDGPVWHASFSADGRRVVTASDDKTARIWDAETGKAIMAPLKHDGPVWHASFSADGHRVVTGCDDKTARVWDADTGEPLTPPLKHEHPVSRAWFSADGRHVLVGFVQIDQGDLCITGPAAAGPVWDVATRKALTPSIKTGASVYHATVSADHRRLVTLHFGTARVWDLETGKILHKVTISAD